MKLNSFLWNIYITSNEGKSSLDFFARLKELYDLKDQKLLKFINVWSSKGNFQTDISIEEKIENISDAAYAFDICIEKNNISTEITSFSEARSFYFNMSNQFIKASENEAELKYFRLNVDDIVDEDSDLENLPSGFNPVFDISSIEELSICLHSKFPKFFFPYYFYPNFYILKSIFEGFGIYLPPVPQKSDRKARFFYYLELCESLYNFWSELKLDTTQIATFLYDYAPNVIGISFPQIDKLPKPRRAWFVGAGRGDFDYLDTINESSRTFWQGNENAEVGDIVVMYCLNPKSCIHSIWRVIRDGDVEPFFYFYSTNWLGYPERVVSIGLNEMKSDEILRDLPLVRSNMQGVNGSPISKKYYDRILYLLKNKGQNIDILEKLDSEDYIKFELKNEKDVEVHILEPLLEKLDYEKNDWERQVSLKVGRSEKIIPDYLIQPVRDSFSKGVKAKWVWEAKYTIKNNRQLRSDFEQAVSYARLVSSKGVSLLSSEGLWIGLAQDDFKFEKVVYFSIKQLFDLDGLSELRKITSKRSIMK